MIGDYLNAIGISTNVDLDPLFEPVSYRIYGAAARQRMFLSAYRFVPPPLNFYQIIPSEFICRLASGYANSKLNALLVAHVAKLESLIRLAFTQDTNLNNFLKSHREYHSLMMDVSNDFRKVLDVPAGKDGQFTETRLFWDALNRMKNTWGDSMFQYIERNKSFAACLKEHIATLETINQAYLQFNAEYTERSSISPRI